MHAELMDFNVLLQQSLCLKDSLIDRLQNELEELRGPMPTDDVQVGDSSGHVNTWIPSAFLTGTCSFSLFTFYGVHFIPLTFLKQEVDQMPTTFIRFT